MIIDRPLGSKHPEHHFVYELNYGYLEGVKAPDGENFDAYYVGENKPLEKGIGKCIAIVHRKDDDDDKLIVSKKDLSNKEIEKLIDFQEKYFDHEIIR